MRDLSIVAKVRACVAVYGLALLLGGCGRASGGGATDPHIWTDSSVGIDYGLIGPLATQATCSVSLERSELSSDDIAQLSALTLIEGEVFGCDEYKYEIRIRDKDGSFADYEAWESPECRGGGGQLIRFADFNAWATAHGCAVSP